MFPICFIFSIRQQYCEKRTRTCVAKDDFGLTLLLP